MTQLADTLPQILEKTQNGKLAWEELSFGSSFMAKLRTGSLEVLSARSHGVGYVLNLRNEAGQVIESISTDELPPPIADMLHSLYTIVRRQALRVNEALDQLKRELESL